MKERMEGRRRAEWVERRTDGKKSRQKGKRKDGREGRATARRANRWKVSTDG